MKKIKLNPKLTILIPTLEDRKDLLLRLMRVLEPQCDKEGVAIIQYCDNREITTGAKRNCLLDACKTEYSAFIDDDDVVSTDYCELVLQGINTGADCIGFKGQMTGMGRHTNDFIISDRYPAWSETRTVPKVYFRPILHLSPIKTDIARQIKYEDKSFGEDADYSMRLKKSGLIKKEYFIDKHLYFYQYNHRKTIAA